ncbi:hypothetical protein [Chlamydiifrater phoenicopteri]|uniref:hypothetical protein n=1 Tax=Chlamydiifrater phoenicopteri TaxID=2681469 RepID=UPI001BD185A0|nr:hypothetical protein [Chlamydiifrater phoenicopteri]
MVSPTPSGTPVPLDPQVTIQQPGSSSEGQPPASQGPQGASSGVERGPSVTRHEYSFHLGFLQSNFVDLARQILELIDSITSGPRVTAGARACHDHLGPCCEAPCGCPTCGCPDGQCGCGRFGKFLCDCFSACFLLQREDDENPGAKFFLTLEEKYGPLAVGLAFNEMGLSLTEVFKGSLPLTEDQKRELEAKASSGQDKLLRIGLKKQGEKIQKLLSEVRSGQHSDIKDQILQGIQQLTETDPKDWPERRSVFVEFCDGTAGTPPTPISEEDLREMLLCMSMGDTTLGHSGGIGVRDASAAARLTCTLLSKWAGSSAPGVKVCIPEFMLNLLLALVLLLLGYVPGTKEKLSKELLRELKNYGSSLGINGDTLRSKLLGEGVSTPEDDYDLSDDEDGSSEGARGQDEPDMPLLTSPRKPRGPKSSKALGIGFRSVEQQRKLVDAVRKVHVLSTSFGISGGPIATQPRPSGFSGKSSFDDSAGEGTSSSPGPRGAPGKGTPKPTSSGLGSGSRGSDSGGSKESTAF